jgi:ribosome maturation factor RimP
MAQVDLAEHESLRQQLTALARRVAASMGMEVVLVELKGGAGRSVVRIFIDQPGGISLDDCERFSKRVSVALDVEDLIPFSYVLEVSSPGLDRPLVQDEDYRRYAGRLAKIRLHSAREGRRNFQARILGVDQGRIRLETEPGKELEVSLPDIEKANLVIEL